MRTEILIGFTQGDGTITTGGIYLNSYAPYGKTEVQEHGSVFSSSQSFDDPESFMEYARTRLSPVEAVYLLTQDRRWVLLDEPAKRCGSCGEPEWGHAYVNVANACA